MFNGFMTELALASLLIALPALFVLVYQRGEKNGRKQINYDPPIFIKTPSMRGQIYGVTEVRQMRQKQMDDRIFNTVKEFRNGVD